MNRLRHWTLIRLVTGTTLVAIGVAVSLVATLTGVLDPFLAWSNDASIMNFLGIFIIILGLIVLGFSWKGTWPRRALSFLGLFVGVAGVGLGFAALYAFQYGRVEFALLPTLYWKVVPIAMWLSLAGLAIVATTGAFGIKGSSEQPEGSIQHEAGIAPTRPDESFR